MDAEIPFGTIPLLASLKQADRAALAPLCRTKTYAKGDTVLQEGDDASRIFFIVAGRVKIVKAAGARDVILEILEPGEPVGAVAVFERRPFPASAIAIEAATLLSIPEPEFFALIQTRPDMTRAMLGGLTMRLMMLNKRLADMTGAAESRAARMFLTFAERLGVRDADCVRVPLILSRQELADLLGITLETAIRLMSRWQKEGVVVTDKEGFRIVDIEALRKSADT